ncbi:hypothetical protein [Paenibacillus massiliensis]|uniref:hypothetical protein n=1 Tax=Paenibacillus massiliensis TaxID=225917 RepID=UPI0003718522|nr:hypothetical protein [Paenibacillus massiliensis]
MKITLYKQGGSALIYLYFFSSEQCKQLNNGGEYEIACDLLFDAEDEWLGVCFTSKNLIEDHLEPNDLIAIRYSEGAWTILFRADKTVAREEAHSCTTDLHNNQYTGIEFILPEQAIPKHAYINELLIN